MKNILFIDNIDVPDIDKRLESSGIELLKVYRLEVVDDPQPYVKKILDCSHGVGCFAILTTDKRRFAKNFPNNTVELTADGNVDLAVSNLVYIMTNFGRDRHGRVFIVSDTHFFHQNIIKYCNRPWATAEEMNDALVENWNSVVGKDDTVIHLGDFSFGGKLKVEEVFKRLNGRIDLVLGNHDRLRIRDYYEMGFHRIYDKPVLYDNFFILSHAPLQWVKDGDVYANIFGHVHDMELYNTWTKNSCCACVERHGYKPIPMEYVKKKLAELNGIAECVS